VTDFHITGSAALLQRIGVSRNSDFYLWPIFIPAEHARWAAKLGCARRECARGNLRSLEAITPGMAQVVHTPHLPQGPPGSGPESHSRAAGLPSRGIVRLRVCLNWRTRATFRSGWSCRIGVCHSWMTGLIGGSSTYNPEPLERPAPGNVLVCCSQPNAGVTLDL
jgi:hypothetical protein